MPVPASADPPAHESETRRALIVCTANVCRSPVIAQVLQRELDGVAGLDGRPWVVASAGIRLGAVPLDGHTVTAAEAIGIDISAHQPRLLTGELLESERPDLVVCAAREHVRTVVGLDPGLWTRTFTLRELARRSAAIAAGSTHIPFDAWLDALGEGRRAANAIGDDEHDDLTDPYGRPVREHEHMIGVVDTLVGQIVRTGPWRPAPASAPPGEGRRDAERLNR